MVEDDEADPESSLPVSGGDWARPGGAAFRGGLVEAAGEEASEFVDLHALGVRSALVTHALPARSHVAHLHSSIPNSTRDAVRIDGGIRHAPQ